MENLNKIDKEIEEYFDFNLIENKRFKFKFNSGSSSAVKRDISLSEIERNSWNRENREEYSWNREIIKLIIDIPTIITILSLILSNLT